MFAGAHGIANGLNAVLDAARVLKVRQRRDVQIILVGDGKVKPQLQARCEREGLSNCRFLDPLPKRQLAGLLAEADVGLMVLANVPAFYYGTSPNKFFDYIAAGMPVLNNYPGWLASLIREHECGLTVAPDDAEAFADAINRIADDRERRMRMRRNARRLAEDDFDRRVLANRLVDFLEKVAGLPARDDRGRGTRIGVPTTENLHPAPEHERNAP